MRCSPVFWRWRACVNFVQREVFVKELFSCSCELCCGRGLARGAVAKAGSTCQSGDMPFLPVAGRELRVAARKRRTTWLRVVAAIGALAIGAGFLMMNAAIGANSSSFGRGLFGTLTWLSLAAGLMTGIFLTADCISEEKREGTLGFLFLTDLRGYDVVGGKLMASSLRAFFPLLAIFPILATSLLMGGVTPGQFWKGALALLNVLFFSLSAGLLVSSFSRDSQRAMMGTLLVLLFCCAAGPFADSIMRAATGRGANPLFSLSSPVYVFWAASAWGHTGFWGGLAVNQLEGWAALALACWRVPRSWQERRGELSGWGRFFLPGVRFGRRPAGFRRRRIESVQPVLWLVLRERWLSAGGWILAGLVLTAFLALNVLLQSVGLVIWNQVSWVVTLILYIWTSSQACRFFSDARRSGTIELLLVTPLSGQDIVLGQWRAMVRLFGAPCVAFVLVQFAGALVGREAAGRIPNAMSGLIPSLVFQLLIAGSGCVVTLANLAALAWFGMWMGLTSRNPALATLRTILFAQVLPWLGVTFLSTLVAGLLIFQGILVNAGGPNASAMLFSLMVPGIAAILTLAKDAAFIFWSRNQLFKNFRSEASRAARETWRPILAPVPNAPLLPPPIR